MVRAFCYVYKGFVSAEVFFDFAPNRHAVLSNMSHMESSVEAFKCVKPTCLSTEATMA